MRKLGLMLVAMAAPAAAQSGNSGQNGQAPAQPDVTVRAPERIVCRPVARTATRMRAARQCRTVSQWAANDPRTDDDRIEESADRLDALGADDAATGDAGGMGSDMDTPLGPR